MKWKLAVASAAALALVVAATLAKEGVDFRKKLDGFSQAIADLNEADVTAVASRDIELIRSWINQAQAFLASDKAEEVNRLLQRIEAQAEYVKARIDRAAAEDAADEAQAAAESAEEQAGRARQAADAAEARQKELEGLGL